MSFQMLKTSKNKPAIFYQNYYFNLHRHNKKANSDYYKCRVEKCPAYLTISCLTSDILRSNDNHSHDPKADIIKDITTSLANMRLRAENEPGVTINEIYEAEVLTLQKEHENDELAKHLPELESLKSVLYRVRLKTFPPLPKSLDDLRVLPERFTKTSKGDTFLISKPEDYNKVFKQF